MEINPHHPVTEKLHDHWHKICGVLLMKMGLRPGAGEIVITAQDVDKFIEITKNQGAIICHDKRDGIHLRMVDEAEAQEIARKELQ